MTQTNNQITYLADYHNQHGSFDGLFVYDPWGSVDYLIGTDRTNVTVYTWDMIFDTFTHSS